jgi:hypothetical protein
MNVQAFESKFTEFMRKKKFCYLPEFHAFLNKVRDFDRENGTQYVFRVSKMMNREEVEDEPVAFDDSLFNPELYKDVHQELSPSAFEEEEKKELPRPPKIFSSRPPVRSEPELQQPLSGIQTRTIARGGRRRRPEQDPPLVVYRGPTRPIRGAKAKDEFKQDDVPFGG